MGFNTPKKNKFIPEKNRVAQLLERPERSRALNVRKPGQQFKGLNELGIPVPSNNIEDYVPGINENAMLINSSGRTYMNKARNNMAQAKAKYAENRYAAIAKLEENMAGAPPSKRFRPGTRKRKARRRSTRHRN